MSDISPEALNANITALFSRVSDLERDVRVGLDDRVEALEQTVASLAGKIADLQS